MKKNIITSLFMILLLFPFAYSLEENTADFADSLSLWDKMSQFFVGGWLVEPAPSECTLVTKQTTSCQSYEASAVKGRRLYSTNNPGMIQWAFTSYDDSSCKSIYRTVETGVYKGNGNTGYLMPPYANKYYAFRYEKYECGPAGVSPPAEQKTFQGYCLDSSNVCIYISKKYTEQQQIKSEYESFRCIKPAFPNLYSTEQECQLDREEKITCYTSCDGGKYEIKKVEAAFCGDVGLRSIPPDDCSSPDAKPCTYEGITYGASDIFCYQHNVVRCVDGLVLNTIELCPETCEDGKCVLADQKEEDKLCCGYWSKSNEKVEYVFQSPTVGGACPVFSTTGLFPLVSTQNLCKEGETVEYTPSGKEIEKIEGDEQIEGGKEGIEEGSLENTPEDELEDASCKRNSDCKGDAKCIPFDLLSGGVQDRLSKGIFNTAEKGICVISPEGEEFGQVDWCGWTSWAPELFGTRCSSAYVIIIGGLVLLMFLSQLGGKK